MGRGMTPEVLSRIFRPFEQGNDDFPWPGATAAWELGMAAIAKASRSTPKPVTISAASAAVRDAAPPSRVTFPSQVAPVSAPPASPIPARPAAADRRPIKILLVEDYDDTARVLARLSSGATRCTPATASPPPRN